MWVLRSNDGAEGGPPLPRRLLYLPIHRGGSWSDSHPGLVTGLLDDHLLDDCLALVSKVSVLAVVRAWTIDVVVSDRDCDCLVDYLSTGRSVALVAHAEDDELLLTRGEDE